MRAPQSLRTRILLGCATTVAVAFAGGAALSAAGGPVEHGGTNTVPRVPESRAVVAGADAETRSHFAVFRRVAQPADTAPLREKSATVSEHGMNVHESRRIGGSRTPIDVWLTPTADGLCYHTMLPSSIGPGGGCSPLKDFLEGAIDVTTVSASKRFVTGIVPDGFDTATVSLEDGSRRTVRVTDNGFSIETSVAAVSVELESSDGKPSVSHGVSVPAGAE